MDESEWIRTIAGFLVSMNFPFFVNEYKSACNFTHDLPRSRFSTRGLVVFGDRPARFIIVIQIHCAQLHIDEKVRQIGKVHVSQDSNDIPMTRVTEFRDNTNFIPRRSVILSPELNELPCEDLRSLARWRGNSGLDHFDASMGLVQHRRGMKYLVNGSTSTGPEFFFADQSCISASRPFKVHSKSCEGSVHNGGKALGLGSGSGSGVGCGANLTYFSARAANYPSSHVLARGIG
jgi:hypothetical protein